MSTEIALNVTRTRVTVLVFNLTVISVMLSMVGARDGNVDQTVTAFMHEYLVGFESAVDAMQTAAVERTQGLVRPDAVGFDALGHTPLLVLLVMGGAIWILMTYGAPLSTGLRSPVRGGRRWVFAVYYFAIQVPIYWVYAGAWHLQYVSAEQPMDMLSLFALQFVQPLLWFR